MGRALNSRSRWVQLYSRPPSGIGSPKLLEAELRLRYGPDVHVVNAALPAARTADKYAVLLRVLATRPALVIFQEKYLEFSRAQVESLVMRYPYLNPVIAEDPDYSAHYAEFNVHAAPPLTPPSSPTTVAAARAVDRAFSVYRFRGLLQRLSAGGDLFARLAGAPAEPPIPPVDGPMCRGFNPIARDPASFTGAYQSGPFDAFPNAGLYFAARAADAIDRAGVPAFSYVAALNHPLLGSLATGPGFDRNVGIVDSVFSGRTFAFRDYATLALDDPLFLDTEHLSDLGHRAMVDRLLDDFGPVFARALDRR